MARTEVTGRQIRDKSVSLADDVVDTLPVANGGTGTGTLSAGGVLVGSGTDAVTAVSPGTSGHVLTSNGSAWVSAAPSGEVTLNGSETLYNKTISGSSNTISDLPQSAVTGLVDDLAAKEDVSNKGSANGYAALDETGKVPLTQVPAGVVVDGVQVSDDAFQLLSGETPVGDPISLLVSNADGGTPYTTSLLRIDGGRLA